MAAIDTKGCDVCAAWGMSHPAGCQRPDPIKLTATNERAAGGVVAPAADPRQGSTPEQVDRRASALGFEREAFGSWLEASQAGSWRSILTREGTIGGLRLA